jgi:membrane protein DedA with SNARE-associated domain
MTHHTLELLREALVHYGYWAVVVLLLLENAGVPVPGETVLLLASFLAYTEQDLRLGWIVAVATLAATVGDNIGYAIGNYGGRRVLKRYRDVFRISDETLARGERLFERYGSGTILFSRFVFGMRVIAGPLAGVLRMPWRSFAVFNFLGAVLWVSAISLAGYFFGGNWRMLMHFIKRVDLALAAVFVLAAAIVLWRNWKRGS